MFSTVAAIALFAALPADAIFFSGASVISGAFGGNPNARVSAIDTSGGITSSRVSAELPAFVHVSASAMLATGTIVNTAGTVISGATVNPYEDLEYSWDFGDPSGTELFLDPSIYPYTGIVRNANTSQTGPEAAYCYRTAGSKTITLNIRAKSGANSFITTSKTLIFTASAFTATRGTYYIDSVNGNNANNGTSPSTPWKNIAYAITHIPNFATLGPQTAAIYHAQGSHWKYTDGDYWGNLGGPSHVRFGSFVGPGGAGADPIIEMDGSPGALAPYFFNNSFGAADDIVVSNIHAIIGVNSTAQDFQLYCTGNGAGGYAFTNFYADNCQFENLSPNATGPNMASMRGNAAGAPPPTVPAVSNVGFWVTNGKPGKSLSTPQICGSFFGTINSWAFIMGGSATSYGAPSAFVSRTHYWYFGVRYHLCCRYINCLPVTASPGVGDTLLGSSFHDSFLNWYASAAEGAANDTTNAFFIYNGGAGYQPSVTTNGITINGSTTVTFVSTTGMFTGQNITGPNIPAGTTIVVANATTVTLSQNATGSGTVSLTTSRGIINQARGFVQVTAVANAAALPGGASFYDAYATTNTGHLWVWGPVGFGSSGQWIDLGLGLISSVVAETGNPGFSIFTIGSYGLSSTLNPAGNFFIGQTIWVNYGSINYSQGCVITADHESDASLSAGVPSQGPGNIFWAGRQFRVNNSPADITCADILGNFALQYAEFHCFDSNYVQGPGFGYESGDPPGFGSQMNQMRNIVYQKCTGFGLNCFHSPNQLASITVRDGKQYGALVDTSNFPKSLGTQLAPTLLTPAVVSLRMYRNKGYNHTVLSLSGDVITATCPLQFTDNEIWDNRTNSEFPYNQMGAIQANGLSGGNDDLSTALVDRNVYYAPNYPGGAFILEYKASTLETLAAWQTVATHPNTSGGLDPNSTGNVQPAWPNPVIGNFG